MSASLIPAPKSGAGKPLRNSLTSTTLVPTSVNKTILQGFEWYSSDDGSHYRKLTADLPVLAEFGITSIWLPPSCKATGPRDNGYGIYGNS